MSIGYVYNTYLKNNNFNKLINIKINFRLRLKNYSKIIKGINSLAFNTIGLLDHDLIIY
jgi:hypothetical protein